MFNRLNLKKRIFAFFAAVSGCILLASAIIVFSPDAAAEETLTKDSYIYFDLSAGDVEIYSLPGGSATYKGYRYDGESTRKEISGTYTSGLKFFVYQSDDDINTGIIGDKVVLPTHNRVSGWADYCTNNSNVEAVIGEWIKRADAAGRVATGNRIHVVGKVDSTIVIDNLYSSYAVRGNSRTTSAITFLPQGLTPGTKNPSGGPENPYYNVQESYLTIRFKGDNRFCNILYSATKSGNVTNKLIFEGYTEDATLTCANLEQGKDTNWWCAAIGGDDGARESSRGIFINSGIIYAGTNAGDDCTAIGGGGNGTGEITITGGTVTASVTSSGAAIGGGIGKSSKGGQATVKITGGKVYAYNFSCECPAGYTYTNKKTYIPAAAIGGGSSGKSTCNDCTVEISGDAYVYAQSVGGTAIGGGSSADTKGGAATVTISGNAEVHAYSVAGKINGVDVPAGAGIGGGTGGTGPKNDKGEQLNADGGSVTLTIKDNAKVYTGSVGGGSTNDKKSKIGHAVITISDNAKISGQFIMAAGANTACSFTMSGGEIDNTGRKASDFLRTDGGAVYMDDPSGVVTISGGTIKKCSGEKGGAIYMTAGTFNLSGTGRITECTASDSGGAVYLGGGNVNVSGGSIDNNTASVNGGGVSITNGNYTMTGGTVTDNTATSGNGGGIYVSSIGASDIRIRSGNVTNNSAGNGGGALGVHGTESAAFTIIIGSDTDHTGLTNAHVCSASNEPCPVITGNTSQKVGGGIYLAGSYKAELLMYCIVESGNKVGDGTSPSNFMKVEGGTLVISTRGKDGTSADGSGNIVINNSVHVTGGQVTLMGLGDNPKFTDRITVDVSGSSYFKDLRDKSSNVAFTVQYFENFEENDVKSGQYISIDVAPGTNHDVQAGLYTHGGFLLQAWTVMKTLPDGTHEKADDAYLSATGLKAEYTGGNTIEVNSKTGSIVLYARWQTAGYSIIFLPGVDSYGGSMAQQDFLYTDEKPLTKNAFTNDGYIFSHWKREGTEITYTDQQLVKELANVDGATIKLIAQWTICYHSNMNEYTLSSTADSISRKCKCLGYTETATLEGFTVTYDGATHPAEIVYSRETKNGKKPAEIWNLPISYSGTNAPLNAGNYTATIDFAITGPDYVSASVDIVINKADQSPPSEPIYTTDKKTIDGKEYNVIMVSDLGDTTGKTLEYLFSWYDGETLYTSGWITWNPQNPPIQNLEVTYTNYYVDVRYKETENYNASLPTRGTTTIVWTGNVTFYISAGPGLTRNEQSATDKSGLFVTLTPQEGYYIYNITYTIEVTPANDSYILPTLTDQNPSGEKWVVWIHDIKEATENTKISIHFTGAELKATVEADTVKDQVFSSIYDKGQQSVSVSRDSAYTVYFDVDNYKHYSTPEIKFNQFLPVGTTLLMIDQSDSSYWGYTVNTPVTQVLLASFVRMGGTDNFVIGDRTSFDLQFVVDFSRCATPLNTETLTAQFNAEIPLGSYVPLLPTDGDAISTVSLVATPQFNVSETKGTFDDPLAESVSFNYAISAESVGTSKWDSRRGVLVITPADLSTLPADARLQVTIGNSTNVYGLKDGKYIVALPSGNSGEVSITFLSDMIPVGTTPYNFTVNYYSSETLVGSTPTNVLLAPLAVPISYTVTKSAQLGLKAQITPSTLLPQYNPGDESVEPSISSLYYSVWVSNLPQSCTVKATLYGKDANGGYSATTQSSNLPLSNNNNSYSGTLELASLVDGMKMTKGSLSMMLRIEIVDANGKVVNYVPLYFIVVDPRE